MCKYTKLYILGIGNVETIVFCLVVLGIEIGASGFVVVAVVVMVSVVVVVSVVGVVVGVVGTVGSIT